MPRVCTICGHPERKEIDGLIADKQSYRSIASRFGVTHTSVTRHGKNHVEPQIDSIEAQANAVVLERVMSYRDEVNLPLPEKSKYIENKLWTDYYAVIDPVQRMAIVREINKQQAEQAKLGGDYTKERENPDTLVNAKAAYMECLASHQTSLDTYNRILDLMDAGKYKEARQMIVDNAPTLPTDLVQQVERAWNIPGKLGGIVQDMGKVD